MSRLRPRVAAALAALLPMLAGGWMAVPAAVMAAPAGKAPAVAGSDANVALHGTRWGLRVLDKEPVLSTPSVGLVLQAGNGRLAGSTGCQRLAGRYQQRGIRLLLRPASLPKIPCAAPLEAQAERFLQALAEVDSYRIEGDRLSLLRGDTVLAQFVRR